MQKTIENNSAAQRQHYSLKIENIQITRYLSKIASALHVKTILIC